MVVNDQPLRIGIIIPDRGDRPQLMENCLRMLSVQTLRPAHIEVVDFKPVSDDVDITFRYRIGYERMLNRGLDVIALVENDDWYHPQYLEYYGRQWENYGKPQLFGPSFTVYYHLGLKQYLEMIHYSRASACNTFIVPDMDFQWCPDTEPYTDMHLWHNVKKIEKRTFNPEKLYSIGIKHGIGKTGGPRHTTRLERYTHADPSMEWLREKLDPVSFEFYSRLEVPALL